MDLLLSQVDPQLLRLLNIFDILFVEVMSWLLQWDLKSLEVFITDPGSLEVGQLREKSFSPRGVLSLGF